MFFTFTSLPSKVSTFNHVKISSVFRMDHLLLFPDDIRYGTIESLLYRNIGILCNFYLGKLRYFHEVDGDFYMDGI